MVWRCFITSGPGRLAVMDKNMNSALYEKILTGNIRPLVTALVYGPRWVPKQHNNPKNTSKPAFEWLQTLKSSLQPECRAVA